MIGGRMDKFIEVKEFDSIIGNPNFMSSSKILRVLLKNSREEMIFQMF